MKQDMILILDLGSEENPRLAREIRALGVYSEIHPHDITAEELAALPNVKGIILNGGPNRVVDGVEIDAAKEIYNAPVPVLLADHKGDQPWPEDAAARKEALSNFVFQVCGAQANWNMENFIADQVELIRQQVGDRKVLLALSGGVDSTVVAVLLHKAIGKNLHCIFVDNGVLRSGEGDEVVTYLREHFDLNLKLVNAQDRFLDLLAGVEDPEKKRKIIGHTFIDVFDEEARAIGNVEWLAQGTLYPDVIESVSHKGPSAVIKSHHNVGGLPEKMNMKLIEPLRELFKDEVRQVGAELGMPESVIWRQPFPGPGLAIRVIGEVTRERLDILRKADTIVQQELRDAGWYRKIWQGFAVLLPLKTVGVMGDGRTYEHVIALRCVDSVDAMTADWARLPYDLLERISRRIINEVKGVNRVVYDVSSKPPSTIEWE